MQRKGIFLALAAACLYALSSPVSKLLLADIPPALLAGFLYLGAGLSMLLLLCFQPACEAEERLIKSDVPFLLLMVLLDIAAPVLLLWGLKSTSAAGVSLLNNFEIVATALIAFLFFKEGISRRLWLGIALVTLSCVLLSWEGTGTLHFSAGSLLVLGATLCWGLENNCTRRLSNRNPLIIVLIKGFGSGTGSLIIGLVTGESIQASLSLLFALLLGAVAYGLSIFCYIYAQRYIGAARTGAFYAVCPFIGAILSLIIFGQLPSGLFIPAFLLMLAGAWFCLDGISLKSLFGKEKLQ